ncbi:MAG: hypothetical protein IJW92_00380 [Clostridia bacterium]|nr:hypothetical protein [Clostridia bacterium]
MENSLFERLRFQKIQTRYVGTMAVLILFYAAVCNPLWLTMYSDAAWRTSVIPSVLNGLMQLLNYLTYWISFAFVIYAGLRFSFQKSVYTAALYAILSVVKYVAYALSGCLVMSISFAEFFESDFLSLIFSLVMDFVQMGIALLLLWLMMRKQEKENSPLTPAVPCIASFLPFERFFDLKNRLLVLTLKIAAIPAGVQLLSRLYYDIFFYGAPADFAEVIVMVIYYGFDLFCVLLGYLTVFLMLNRLYLDGEKAKIAEEIPKTAE